MSKKLYEETDIQAIANAIRTQNSSTDTYKVSQMADAILALEGGSANLVEAEFRENGTFYPPEEYDGFSSATVNVKPKLDTLHATENGEYPAPAGKQGYKYVIVDVPRGYQSPHTYGLGTFYLAALMGEDEVELEYRDPNAVLYPSITLYPGDSLTFVVDQMYTVTIPNDLNILQWECTAVEVEE